MAATQWDAPKTSVLAVPFPSDADLDDLFRLDVQVSTDAPADKSVKACGTNDGCAGSCASACASAV